MKILVMEYLDVYCVGFLKKSSFMFFNLYHSIIGIKIGKEES